ncbi:dethiobiotin synthase [Sulfurirhabdus autotrophica]|uniref:ATP-dependent dethiobiotin synthetase BioD n=1 Tax=Sulfurirhabdus autotrophica TaxID=1706046 RepID=A0A4R3Y361_9PROT|nr:dethiobiotin synthase [Sulfurirhabdus autotrophica]TCV84764.1 dethiobiotin synthetase [Sulfurirhabdus autotrophica]
MKKNYFVTGTDTGVGKTLITSALLHALAHQGKKVVGMKPIAAGCEPALAGMTCGDVEMLQAHSNVAAPLNLVNPYSFLPPVAPHIAAAQANVEIDLAVIVSRYQALQEMAEVVMVEGVGGFVVPLTASKTTADLAVMLNLPVILVVGMRLGCINHALLTVQAIRQAGLELVAWVANQVGPEMQFVDENIRALENRIDAPLMGICPYQDQATPIAASKYLDIKSFI